MELERNNASGKVFDRSASQVSQATQEEIYTMILGHQGKNTCGFALAAWPLCHSLARTPRRNHHLPSGIRPDPQSATNKCTKKVTNATHILPVHILFFCTPFGTA